MNVQTEYSILEHLGTFPISFLSLRRSVVTAISTYCRNKLRTLHTLYTLHSSLFFATNINSLGALVHTRQSLRFLAATSLSQYHQSGASTGGAPKDHYSVYSPRLGHEPESPVRDPKLFRHIDCKSYRVLPDCLINGHFASVNPTTIITRILFTSVFQCSPTPILNSNLE